MVSVVETIRKIAEIEVKKLHLVELGVVTSVFPHSSDSDKDNYECNVKLKNREVELRRVPVATQHIGLVNIPHIGDLVLVAFLNGDINSPVIIGRLYTDEDRPPTNKMGEVIYKPPYSRQEGLRRIHFEFPGGMILSITDGEIDAKAGKTIIKMNRDGDITIESNADIFVKTKGATTVTSDGDITLESRQAINIKAGTTANIESSGPMNIKGVIVNIN